MRKRFKGAMMAIATAAVVAPLLLLAVRPTAGQSAAYRAPRLEGHPNLNGKRTRYIRIINSNCLQFLRAELRRPSAVRDDENGDGWA
jgi:hypothetical protein